MEYTLKFYMIFGIMFVIFWCLMSGLVTGVRYKSINKKLDREYGED